MPPSPFSKLQALIPSAPKAVFLMDGLGALASMVMLGGVLVRFEAEIGMPKAILFRLALAAAVFAIYSLSCSFFLPANWRPWLKGILFANLAYAAISAVLVVQLSAQLTGLGVTYFVLELLVLAAVIGIEGRAAFRR